MWLPGSLSWQEEVQVADEIVALIQHPGSFGLANTTLAITGRSALVVDTLLLPEMAAGMHALLRRRHLHADVILNTHHHVDHVGGNSTFPASTPIVAHPVTARIVRSMAANPAGFAHRMPNELKDRIAELKIRPPVPLGGISPQTFPGDVKLLVFEAAHSPADVAVWFPRSRVLVAGDLCFNGVTPLALHGSLPGWITALRTLIDLRPRTVVPGHGVVGDATTLAVLADHLQSTWGLAVRAVRQRIPADEALGELAPLVGWLEPQRCQMNLETAMAQAKGQAE